MKPDLAKDLWTAGELRVLYQIRDFFKKGFHDAAKATKGRRATLD